MSPRAGTTIDDLELDEIDGGTRLRLRVKPGARRRGLLGTHGGALKIAVTAAPEKGKANVAVCRLLAEALGLAASELEIVSGHTSRDKVVRLPLRPDQVRRLLSAPRD